MANKGHKQKAVTKRSSEAIEGDILQKLPPEEREIIASIFSGPLPPPDEFNKYPPKVQESIVRNATSQMKHRHNMESKIVSSDTYAVRIGSIGTLIIFLVALVGAIYLMSIGKTVEGAFLGLAAGAAKAFAMFRSNASMKTKPNNKSKDTDE
jgi:uncharacterized membrane protein